MNLTHVGLMGTCVHKGRYERRRSLLIPRTVGRPSPVSQLSSLCSKALVWDWEAAPVQGRNGELLLLLQMSTFALWCLDAVLRLQDLFLSEQKSYKINR